MAIDKLVDFDHVTDYISREAAEKTLIEYFLCSHISETFIKAVVEQIPAADVVEVVRCIDCVHLDPETNECRSPFGLEHPNFNCYCSGGRRRQNDSG